MTDALQVEYRPIDSLIGYERNPRAHPDEQIEQIAASIEEFGWTNPILIDDSGRILAGHARIAAAHLLGLAEVPVIALTHLTDESKKRAYVIADNAIPLNAEWDMELLKLEVAELRMAGYDLELTGLNDLSIFEEKLEAAESSKREFRKFDESIDVEHKCPKCGYEWSGKPS